MAPFTGLSDAQIQLISCHKLDPIEQGVSEGCPECQHQMDTLRCQNHNPVRVLVPLLEFNQEAFPKTEAELGQANALWVIGEGAASLVRNAIVSAVDLKAIQVRITPTHGDLNSVMEVSDAVVAPQEQSAPDHRADAAQNHLELVNA
jgi:hypothetical protein